MKSFQQPSRANANCANVTVQRVRSPLKTIVDNRPAAVMQRRLQEVANSYGVLQKRNMLPPIQLMKKWTKTGGFEEIMAAPGGSEEWLRCKYGSEQEELFISNADMEHFSNWDAIAYYDDDIAAEMVPQSEQEPVIDGFPNFAEGEVTSITIIKESRSDHQYVIAMVKGGPNIKLHYGVNGGLIEQSDDIDNTHGIPVSHYNVPEGLTGAGVVQIFEDTKASIESRFSDANCGGLASRLVGELGATNQEEAYF